MSKVLMPRYVFEFTTTAARLAYSFGANDRGSVVFDYENDQMYLVRRPGAGADRMAPISSLEQGVIEIPLTALREISSGSDVGDVAAIGGVLASDTTPILRADSAESWELSWAAGNADIVGIGGLPVPNDFDGSRDATIQATVYTDNAGGGGIDAATLTVETGWDGGTLVSDAVTDSTPAITKHTNTGTIAAADMPDAPKQLSVAVTVAAHANDPVQLTMLRILYYRK